MKTNPYILTGLLPMIVAVAPAQQAQTAPAADTVQMVLDRMVADKVIDPTPTTSSRKVSNRFSRRGRNRQSEVWNHFRALQNGSESINDFPWISYVLTAYLESSNSRVVRLMNVSFIRDDVGMRVAPPELIQQLLAAGADPNVSKAIDDRSAARVSALLTIRVSALAIAAACSADITKALLDAGASLDVVELDYGEDDNGEGDKPLGILAVAMHGACMAETSEAEMTKVVDLLLAAGADVNGKDAEGVNALFWAARMGATDLCLKLIKAGADTTLQVNDDFDENDGGEPKEVSATDAALTVGQLDTVRALVAAGVPSVTLAREAGEDVAEFLLSDNENKKKMIANGFDVNRNVKDMPLLMLATALRLNDTVQIMLEAGADANAVNKGGLNALFVAVRLDDAPMADMLLSKGAKADASISVSSRDVELAQLISSIDMLEVFEKYGFDLSKNIDSESIAALFMNALTMKRFATKVSEKEKAQKLIDRLIAAGYDTTKPIETPFVSQASGLSLIVLSCDLDLLKQVLAAGADLKAVDAEMSLVSALLESAGNDEEEQPEMLAMLKYLVEAGVNLNVASPHTNSESIVEYLIDNGCMQSLQILLDAGLDLNAENVQASKLMRNAIENGDAETCRLLATHGVKLKGNALAVAAILGDVEKCRELLAGGAKLNVSFRRHTPLVYAAYMGNPEVCKLLIEAGADVNAKDNSEWTPVDAAVDRCDIEMLKLLVAAGASVADRNDLLVQAAAIPDANMCRELIAMGVPVQSKPGTDSALHAAVQEYDALDTVMVLIDAGADVNAPDENGDTPLIRAVQASSSLTDKSPLYRMLVKAGADENIKGKQGKSAAEMVKKSNRSSSMRYYSTRRSF